MTAPERLAAPPRHEGPVLETSGAHEVIDCRSCGYAHVLPMPTVAELKRLYAEKFYGEDKADYLTRMEQDIEWWNMVYAERLESMARLLGPARGRRILDVGCSGGFFLAAAASHGWQTQGVELGRQAAEYAAQRGIPVRNEDIQDVDWPALGGFDAAYMSFVLEHLPNPGTVLGRLTAVLPPGGILCIEVPNDFNPLQALVEGSLGAKPYWVAPDHHLNYFTPAGLRRLLDVSGYDCVETEGTFPMELFLLMGDDYVGNDTLGRQLHGKRKRLELLLSRNGLGDFKRALYKFMMDHRVGREVVMYARRR